MGGGDRGGQRGGVELQGQSSLQGQVIFHPPQRLNYRTLTKRPFQKLSEFFSCQSPVASGQCIIYYQYFVPSNKQNNSEILIAYNAHFVNVYVHTVHYMYSLAQIQYYHWMDAFMEEIFLVDTTDMRRFCRLQTTISDFIFTIISVLYVCTCTYSSNKAPNKKAAFVQGLTWKWQKKKKKKEIGHP